jgi:hypothetical protein
VPSYDDEDLLDDRTVVEILDLQCTMGHVSQLKEEFNQKRKTILSHLLHRDDDASLFQLPESEDVDVPATFRAGVHAYVACVLDYDQQIGSELEANLDEICEALSISKDEVKRS